MKLKLTYKTNKPTGKWSSFYPTSIDVKLNGKKFAIISEKSVLDNSDRLNWRIQICILNDKVENCKWRWWFLKQTFNTSDEAKDWFEDNIEKLCETLVLWMIDLEKPFEKEIMRVRKICNQCKRLKSRLDFPIDQSHEGRGPICNSCLDGSEAELEELNSKIIKNNPLKLNTMSLKEKRAAAAAAEAAKKNKAEKAETKKPTAEKAEAKKPVAEKPVAEKPVAEKPKKEKPKKEKLKISQYDLSTGKLIKEHVDVDAAAAAVGKHRKYIDICGKNGSKSAYGFKWLYEGFEMPKEDSIEEVSKKSKSKKEVVEDTPVPGDLDYDEELHGQKEVVEEEVLDSQDESTPKDEEEIEEEEEEIEEEEEEIEEEEEE